jgi:hypothetical protein
MAEQVVIAERFKGPPGSGHGGYSCAMAAQFIAGPAEVALRRPPPLEIPLEVQTDSDGTVRLLHGDAVVAEARATELELEVPEPVGVEDAGTAALRSPLLDYHPFATCFVCGTDREPGDGVRLFAGPVEGRELYAAPWIPAQDMAGPDGVVVPEFVWSVLDCPGGNATVLFGEPRVSVLARLAARLVAPIEVGRPHLAIGWPIERDGRKDSTGSAIFTADGRLCAFGRALWVQLTDEQVASVGTTDAG